MGNALCLCNFVRHLGLSHARCAPDEMSSIRPTLLPVSLGYPNKALLVDFPFSSYVRAYSSWCSSGALHDGVFLNLPAGLRQESLALAIWTLKPPPCSPLESQDRVRLRDEWDIWVPAVPPEHAVLPIVLTCKPL
ncbi:hypothetical protein B0T14DRAFT_254761 [Immersiella caudata]|uniref:Uncharacterized protein n=1 Tax=Immersiella caudata TaxID=314043 RepID=A0AA39WK98_9PEZI|nr:hypothetical protein B0T14DRAFT_254761 [Immersiella caudata]